MRRMKKFATMILASAIAMSFGTSALAANHWVQNPSTYTWSLYDESNIPQTGWQLVDGVWYYLDASGVMQTGWQNINGKTYYFDASGAMATEWQNINRYEYYFRLDGVMLRNCTTPDGYTVNADGIWTDTYTNDGDPTTSLAKGQSLEALRQAELACINRERAARGIAPVVLNETLNQIAQLRAAELQTAFGHYRPDGTICFTLYDQLGVTTGMRSENCASGCITVRFAMGSWMHSKSHRDTILTSDYRSVGIGIVEGTDGEMYWAQEFWSEM